MAAPVLLRLGTRGSPLALVQAREVAARLAAARPELAAPGAIETKIVKTTGDRVRDRPLAEIGGKGLFTKEIEAALQAGEIDVAVHSMKDVPTWLPEGLVIAAVLPRADPRDAFFSRHPGGLAELPRGARLGTASLRRQAQVLAARPDLEAVNLRGNVDTRLAKLAAGEIDAMLLAVAGLERLGRPFDAAQIMAPDDLLPAAGQGAIGLEIRAEDRATADLVAAVDDADAALCLAAERACLAVLDGSCRTPIGAFAELDGAGLRLRALVAQPDGSALFRAEDVGPRADAVALGESLGRRLRRDAGEAFFAALSEA